MDGEVRWQERLSEHGTGHPESHRFAKVLDRPEVQGGQAERARQFFSWCLVEGVRPANPRALEEDPAACVEVLRARGLA